MSYLYSLYVQAACNMGPSGTPTCALLAHATDLLTKVSCWSPVYLLLLEPAVYLLLLEPAVYLLLLEPAVYLLLLEPAVYLLLLVVTLLLL